MRLPSQSHARTWRRARPGWRLGSTSLTPGSGQLSVSEIEWNTPWGSKDSMRVDAPTPSLMASLIFLSPRQKELVLPAPHDQVRVSC